MYSHIMVGSNDIEKARKFYDALLGTIGAKRMMEADDFIAWSAPGGGPALSVIQPFDKKPATVGNGVMVALAMDSRAKVDAFHAKALSLGAGRRRAGSAQ